MRRHDRPAIDDPCRAHIAPGREGLFELVKAAPQELHYENALIAAAGDYVMLHGRFSGIGRPVNWVVDDILRIENGLLAEHWDVIQDEATRLVDKTVARFGRLDVAVNNAGTEGQVGPITDQSAESYAATFDTNVLGVILSMKHEVRVMKAQGSGSIINISSTYGHEGAAGASIYVGSKHAVEGITKSVALEIAKSGIRVNAVAPGPTDTGMLTRFTGTPENK